MSYAADVKKELTGLRVHDGNAKAELSALMRMNGVSTLGIDQTVSVKTENAAIARRIYLSLIHISEPTRLRCSGECGVFF